jgi:hypothetical protein
VHASEYTIVVKVAVTTFLYALILFCKIMTEAQEVMKRTNSPNFCLRSINKGSFSRTHVGVFLFVQCILFAMLFLPKPLSDHLTTSLRNTVLDGTAEVK